jgi:tRNA pseudouridine32 synthase/23S rRNA pseudouridine746 synthase
MLSQGSKWSDHTTLTRWAELHLQPQRPAFLVHRLDRFADGLMLIAHSKSMARQLAAMFEHRSVDKRYRVWVHGEFPQQAEGLRLEQPLDDKPAISIARLVEFDAASNRSLLEVSIETGRKHQIRRHLAAAGYPVVGDKLHGKDEDGDLRLSAVLLAFEHPQSGEPKRYALQELPAASSSA